MAVIQANRESIDDRFSVLGFTVRTNEPLFEIGLATDPELLKPENRQRRNAGNFFTSRLLGASQSRRGEATYLVPPNVVSRFVGKPRLYFGVATYAEGERSRPASVSIPDRGNMYVSLSGLTERGLRRTARPEGDGSYGTNGNAMGWGGDAAASSPRRNGKINGTAEAVSPDEPPAYSDGYSEDLWQQPGTSAESPAGIAIRSGHASTNADVSPVSTANDNDRAAAVTSDSGESPARRAAVEAQSYARPLADSGTPQRRAETRLQRTSSAQALIGSNYYQPENWVDALRTQLSFFVSSAMWFLGVADTRTPPHSAICQVRVPDGSPEGALHGSAFHIAPGLLLTAAHVVDGASALIVIPGKNGAGLGASAEPFGRFQVSAANMRKHPSYVPGVRDFDMALIRVPAASYAGADQFFNLVEELTQSRPEGVVVCGYAAYSKADDPLEQFVNTNIDPDRQHLHGGHIRSLPTEETFDYDLQSLGGTSGSPVYWIEGGDQPRAHMVGVHVAAHSETTNLGCRITAGKLDWIRSTASAWGQTMAFSLGTSRSTGGRGRSHALGTDGAAEFRWPADVASGNVVVERFVEAFNTRAREGVSGTPAPDANQSRTHEDADDRARNEALRTHIPAISETLRTESGRRDVSEAILAITTVVTMQVLEKISNRLPKTFYAPVSTNAAEPPVDINPDFVLPRALPELSRRIGMFLAWVDMAVQQATSDEAERIRQQKQQWEGMLGMLGAGGTLVGLIPGLGTGATIVGLAVQGVITAMAPDFDRQYSSFASATRAVRATYKALAATVLRELIQHRLGPSVSLHIPLHPDVQGYIDAHAAHVLLGWQDELAFLGGGATSLALGATSRALVIDREDVERAQRHAPHWADLFNWTAPDTVTSLLAPRGMRVQRIQDAIGELNLDRYEVRCTGLPAGWSDTSLLDHLRRNLNEFLDTDNSEFIPYAAGQDDVAWGSSNPVGAVFKIDIMGPDNAAVVGSLVEERRFRFTTVHTPWSGDHPVSGHREFGVRSDGDALVFYTRGADRATNGMFETVVFSGAHHLWLSFQRKLSGWINANGGSATTPEPFSERFHPDVVRILYGSTSQSLSSRALAIPLDPGVGGQSIGLDALSPGDLIVSTARHPVSYAIRAGTLSAISHAMIYVGDGNVIEAVGDGVREALLDTAIGDAILAVAYRDPRVDAAKAAQLVDFARSQLGRGYNYGGAARAGYRIAYPLAGRVLDAIRDAAGVDDTSARTFYCSELVFAAFENAGIPLVAAPASHSTPNDVVRLAGGSLLYVGHLKARDEILGIALGLSSESEAPTNPQHAPDFPVRLIAQPNKDTSWATAMAMLLAWRRDPSVVPETVITELGDTLASSYDQELLDAAQARYGFQVLPAPADTATWHSPVQWANWLDRFGPLWVLIVDAPHAVVIAGIRGDLADPASVQVKVLNPWDTRVAFDGDPVSFQPANAGYEDWIAFEQFASDFGSMASPDYSDWKVLHLPAVTASVQAGGAHKLRLAVPPAVRPLGDPAKEAAGAERSRDPIEPSRVPGTRMSVVRGSAGASTWSLDQLEGQKSPAHPASAASQPDSSEVNIDLGAWPAIEGQAAPLPLTVSFRSTAQGSVGDVRIQAGTPADVGYGVEVVARIEDDDDVGSVAAIRIGIDYRFNGLAQDAPAARIELRLLGDGRHERVNRWLTTAQAA
ncbi:MAG: trypsin-like peptidase domain-containing protein [Pseudomonadota bacterium]|nr:trypsin-like peptidase domain-containing protein [Pseudomonadota bacterium]